MRYSATNRAWRGVRVSRVFGASGCFIIGCYLLVFPRMAAHNAVPVMKPSLALVMLLAVPVLAQQEPSEPPAPSDTVGNQTGEQETESQVPNTDTDQSSGVGATITNAPVIQLPTTAQNQGAENDSDESSNWWAVC